MPALDFGDLVVDLDAWEARLRGHVVQLTKTEFRILAALVERSRSVVTAEELTSIIWGDGWFGDDGVIAFHVCNLRRKLGESASTQKLIRTVRGVGYRFDG